MSVALAIQNMDDFRVARLTLERPERANALVPELVVDLNTRLDEAASADVQMLILQGAGRFFSSGGDVAAFHANDAEHIAAYAE